MYSQEQIKNEIEYGDSLLKDLNGKEAEAVYLGALVKVLNNISIALDTITKKSRTYGDPGHPGGI